MTSVMNATTAKTAWNRLRSIPATYPFAFGVAISCAKTSFSDLLVQKVVQKREQVDWKRNAAFAAFGFFYLGGVQYSIYVSLFSRIFPGAAAFAAKPLREKLKDTRGMFQVRYRLSTRIQLQKLHDSHASLFSCQVAAQVFLDQCVHHPIMYFPAFYCTRELVMHEKPDLNRCLKEYRMNMKEDLHALWKIWVPATLINFAFMPMYARIPFVAGVSLLWSAVLSAMRGGDVAHGEEMAGGAVTGATLHMMEEVLDVLFTSPIELDRTKQHVVITASGHDKSGWVALVSRAIAEAGGSITYSRMVRMGAEFIVLMHVAVAPEEHQKLLKHLRKNPRLDGLHVSCKSVQRRFTGTFDRPVMGIQVRCVGVDR